MLDKERRQVLAREMGILFKDDLVKDALSPSQVEARVKRSVDVFSSAPVLVLVCGEMAGTMDNYPDSHRRDAESTMFIQSVANGISYFMLTAHAYGLATSWYCAPLFAKTTVREVLHLPPTWEPQPFVTLGYPTDFPIRPPKR